MIPPTDVLDLFAGPGGWSLAATVLGLNELGIEYDPTAVRTRTAAGFRSVLADVSELNPANFAARGFIASPPCQAFSNAGAGHGRDYTDQLADAIRRRDWHARPHPDPRVWLVLEVGRWSSRVLLVTDTESVVPVRRARDGLAAYAQGLGDGTLRIRLINLGINPLKKGDVLATSGSGGLYRPGTALAVVTRVTKDGAVARVLSDPATAEYVMVEEAWAPPPTAGPEQETPAP